MAGRPKRVFTPEEVQGIERLAEGDPECDEDEGVVADTCGQTERSLPVLRCQR